jgi:hypothetical protein
MGESPIKIANSIMTMREACIEVGMGDVAGMAKTYCPFGDMYHSDGGRTRAFKVFEADNSAFCFACGRRFDPVSLIAMERDIPFRKAAEWILEHKGYVAPDYNARWEALEAKQTPVDYEALQSALKIACSRMIPDWAERQFEDRVAAKLAQCMAVSRKVSSNDEGRKWLDMSKTAMRQTLDLAIARPTD